MTVLVINAMILDHERLSGIGHYTLEIARYFGQFKAGNSASHSVLVVCRDDAAGHFSGIQGIDVLGVSIGEGRIARVRYEQFGLPVLLRRHGADVLLNPAFTGPLWGARRILTTVHDLYFRTVPDLLPLAQRLYLSTIVPWCCRRSSRVIVPSNATRTDLAHFYPELSSKTVVVPLASRLTGEAERSAAPAGDAKPFVLLVAALTGNKNVEPLVAALARLRVSYPELTLFHIGKDPDGQLESAVARHNGEAWVRTRTNVSDGELRSAYRDCVCLAIPSLYEGFGLPLLEAQALGAPVASSNRGSLPEVGGDGAVYFDPTDPAAIADAIGRLLSSPALRCELRSAGLVNQSRFSWENTAKTTWELMLNEPSPSKPMSKTP